MAGHERWYTSHVCFSFKKFDSLTYNKYPQKKLLLASSHCGNARSSDSSGHLRRRAGVCADVRSNVIVPSVPCSPCMYLHCLQSTATSLTLSVGVCRRVLAYSDTTSSVMEYPPIHNGCRTLLCVICLRRDGLRALHVAKWGCKCYCCYRQSARQNTKPTISYALKL